jgi:starvation-inducible DNA-binding protein
MTIGIAGRADKHRQVVASHLQPLLTDLTALALNGKQSHWHLTGRSFLPVHEQLDRIVDDARGWADDVAERAVALGFPVDGHPAAVATSELPPTPDGFVDGDKVLRVTEEQLRRAIATAREGLEELGELDLVTQDLVIGILHGLEKHLWMVQAQLV